MQKPGAAAATTLTLSRPITSGVEMNIDDVYRIEVQSTIIIRATDDIK